MQSKKEEGLQSTLTEDKLRMWFEKLREMDISTVENKQKLIDTFINAVYVYDDKIIISFNVQKNSETLTLEEIKKSGVQSQRGCKGSQKREASSDASFFCFLSIESR